jgi:uncharacterized membrane protein YeaQ/YmgE (transglycosylase-associated protein family)
VAAIVGLAGATFLGQGLGFIPGSFMTGDPFWAVVGAVLLVAAATLLATEMRRVR